MKQKVYSNNRFILQVKHSILGNLNEFYNKSHKEKINIKRLFKKRYIDWLKLPQKEKDSLNFIDIQAGNQIIRDAKEIFIKHCLKVNLEEGEQILKQQFFK